MRRPHQSLAIRISTTRDIIYCALADPAVQAGMARYGYDQAAFAQGKTLHLAVEDLSALVCNVMGQQSGAAAERDAVRARTAATYQRLATIARVALRDNHRAQVACGLRAPRARTEAARLVQAEQFYAAATNDAEIAAALGTLGIDRTALAAALHELELYKAALGTCAAHRGVVAHAVRKRDAALDAVERWCRDFVVLARLAFADQPGTLVALGIAVKKRRARSSRQAA